MGTRLAGERVGTRLAGERVGTRLAGGHVAVMQLHVLMGGAAPLDCLVHHLDVQHYGVLALKWC